VVVGRAGVPCAGTGELAKAGEVRAARAMARAIFVFMEGLRVPDGGCRGDDTETRIASSKPR
jgi:hypothetical protein